MFPIVCVFLKRLDLVKDLMGAHMEKEIYVLYVSVLSYIVVPLQGNAGYMGVPYLYHHSDKPSGGQSNKIRQNPSTIATTKNGFLCKVC